jgi:hypothetical protein
MESFDKKQWASAPLFLRNGELLGHSSILKSGVKHHNPHPPLQSFSLFIYVDCKSKLVISKGNFLTWNMIKNFFLETTDLLQTKLYE